MMFTLFFSCISQKELEYLQAPLMDEIAYHLAEKDENRIKPNDELYIRISSFDDVAYNFFNTQANTSLLNYGTEASISLVSYTVNNAGYIYFPILGHIYVNNLTVDEATLKLKELLSEYFNQPTVLVKIVNKRITVLGEVNRPGTYTYTSDQINIFEALGLAGSTTVFSDLEEVNLIRSFGDSTIIKMKLDLTMDDILFNENYYLQSNDIIYIRPRNSLKWSVVSIPITLVLSSITTALLILNFLR